jgi:hypothetical protein
LQTSEQGAKLYSDFTVPLLEKITAVTKLGAKEYSFVTNQSGGRKPRRKRNGERQLGRLESF